MLETFKVYLIFKVNFIEFLDVSNDRNIQGAQTNQQAILDANTKSNFNFFLKNSKLPAKN